MSELRHKQKSNGPLPTSVVPIKPDRFSTLGGPSGDRIGVSAKSPDAVIRVQGRCLPCPL